MMNTENRQKSVDHNQDSQPERKKLFTKPELKQRETLPEVTGAFVGSFIP